MVHVAYTGGEGIVMGVSYRKVWELVGFTLDGAAYCHECGSCLGEEAEPLLLCGADGVVCDLCGVLLEDA